MQIKCDNFSIKIQTEDKGFDKFFFDYPRAAGKELVSKGCYLRPFKINLSTLSKFVHNNCNTILTKSQRKSCYNNLGDKMKKKISLLIIVGILLISSISMAANVEAIGSLQKLTLNEKDTGIVGFNIEDYNYYRLRDLAKILKTENLNFSLKGDSKEIFINLNETYDETETNPLENKVGVKKNALAKTMAIKITKDQETKIENLKVYNIDDYNYFKLRDVGKLLDFDVEYHEGRNEAQIFTKKTPIETPAPKPEPKPIGRVILGNERLLSEYSHLIKGKNVGLITNQTGIDSRGARTVDKLVNYPETNLIAIYSPEHGLDGIQKAGAYVPSYTDERLNLPVYSLYGATREPSKAMLKGIDVLIFDIQDIGSRTYTYVSTMNYAMKAASKEGIKFVVLDRPNPLGGKIVEGFMLENKYKTFVGVDNMPMAHGMTIGELAKYYNRQINADLEVIPMINWSRSMIWQDTGLPFAQTSPNIPNLESAFNYMATGIGDGTGLGQGDKFTWVGGKTIDSNEFARRLNSYNLPGIKFTPESKNDRGGVRLTITDYHLFNPQLTGTYILATANQIGEINIPRENDGKIPMFEKIHGSDKMGNALLRKANPEEIVNEYQRELEQFKNIRKQYLIYN